MDQQRHHMNLLLEDELTAPVLEPQEEAEPTLPRIAVVLDNARASERVVRILRATTRAADVSACPVASLEELLGTPAIVVCTEDTAEMVLASSSYNQHVVVCDRGTAQTISALCLSHSQLNDVVGWCGFESIPRPWELVWSIRNISTRGSERVLDVLFPKSNFQKIWRPTNPAERDLVCAAIGQEALGLGAPSRTAENLVDIAHELVMNAMYDAPTDANGAYSFAYDRGANIQLDSDQSPIVRFATNGMLAAIEVVDPFGSLQRHRLFEAISRGGIARGNASLDRSHGGAGLGLQRVFKNSLAVFAEVALGHHTGVTAVLSFDLSPRQCLEAPTSIHYRGP